MGYLYWEGATDARIRNMRKGQLRNLKAKNKLRKAEIEAGRQVSVSFRLVRHRILYGRQDDTFVLLIAFLKRTNDTPPKEIELAKRRFEAYQESIRKK